MNIEAEAARQVKIDAQKANMASMAESNPVSVGMRNLKDVSHPTFHTGNINISANTDEFRAEMKARAASERLRYV